MSPWYCGGNGNSGATPYYQDVALPAGNGKFPDQGCGLKYWEWYAAKYPGTRLIAITPVPENEFRIFHDGAPSVPVGMFAYGFFNYEMGVPPNTRQGTGSLVYFRKFSCLKGAKLAGLDGKYYWCQRPLSPAQEPDLSGGAKSTGCNASSPASLHPITLVSGNKFLAEVDVHAHGADKLPISRHYNSAGAYYTHGMGAGWKLNLDRSLSFETDDMITAYRGSGQQINMVRIGNEFRPSAGGMERVYRLVANDVITGWRFVDSVANTVEEYDTTGRLLTIIGVEGQRWTLTYENGFVAAISNSFGVQILFSFSADGLLRELTQSDGGKITYAYDAKRNLSNVTYPDGKSKTYHYENAGLPNALTGITDEKGLRYASYSYDGQGRAYAETLAGGVDAASLTFGNNNTTVTDPLGTKRTYNFQAVLGVARSTGVNQPGGAGCSASVSTMTYDANANVASRTDFNGSKTCYAYDTVRNLETKRVEGLPNGADCSAALSNPPAPTVANPVRTFSTTWHADWRMPLVVAEPKKRTSYVYNGSTDCIPDSNPVIPTATGDKPIPVLCKKTERATLDPTGSQGFAAALSGSDRNINWTYNQYGQVLSADGLRNEVVDVTTYTYYPATDPDLGKRGNLASITNALGHVTQITAYDLNGRALTIVDPNGVATTLTYTPRGWLKTRTVTASGVAPQTTTYDYDDAGQLIKVTQPDGSYLSYTYDAAHRLTDITDALGNSIHYTLDNAGNRIKEETKDTNQALARQITREYDALNRLKTVTGALQ